MEEQRIIHQGNTFEKVMETSDFTYYMDFSEGDDNGSVRMYDNEVERLVSDNYMANRDLYENLLYFNYEWIGERLIYARKCMVEEHRIDLAVAYFVEHKTEHNGILGWSENAKVAFNKVLRENLGLKLSKNDLQEVRKQLNTNNSKGLSM